MELTFMRLQLSKYKEEFYVRTPLSANDEITGPTSYIGSFFFKTKKGYDEPEEPTRKTSKPEELTRKTSKKAALQISPLSPKDTTEYKVSPTELLSAKKRLSHVPSARKLVKLASLKYVMESNTSIYL